MKTLSINGVPYDSTGQQIFIYGSNKSIQLGTYSDKLNLNDNWQTTEATLKWLNEYRNGLKEATTSALKKATELQKA